MTGKGAARRTRPKTTTREQREVGKRPNQVGKRPQTGQAGWVGERTQTGAGRSEKDSKHRSRKPKTSEKQANFEGNIQVCMVHM